jgi:hypothetical protein
VKFSELWRLSSTVYKEVSFQSIFSLRAGSGLPQSGRRDIKQLVRSAKFNTLISKLVTSVFLAVFAITVFAPILFSDIGPPIPREVAIPGGISAFLTVVLFLIVFMGLQMSTSFVSSKIVDVLSPLPLSKRDISRIVFLCFVRIFDIPLVSAVVIFLAVFFFIGGSILGGIVSLVGIMVTEIFALTLTVLLGKFFYAKVARAGGRSFFQTILRFMFMLVWIIPTFAAYFVVNFAGQIVIAFAGLTQGLASVSQTIVLIYPFSYGFLVSYAAFLSEIDYLSLSLSVVASAAYVLLAYYCLRWVTGTVREIGMGAVTRSVREIVKDTMVKPQIPWVGIIRKDIRVASRSPSYASLFMLPVVQTVVLAVTFSSFNEIGPATALGLLTGISLLTLLLPPTLLSIEGLASAYTKHLPLRKRTLIAAKTLVATTTYIVSIIILTIVAFFIGKDFAAIATFGTIHTFSVAAAIMLEITLMLRKFWKEGFAVGNIYSRITTYVVILIPGYIFAAIPMALAFLSFFLVPAFVLPVFLVAAAVEFTLMTVFVLHQK